jgi:uncharacterized protein YfaS (alpha-2-macroglobulin family)
MASFNRGETAIVSVTIRSSAGTLTTPATSTLITITNPSGVELVSDAAMIEDSEGLLHYDYQVGASADVGRYTVRIVATDASRVSIEDSDFEVMP